MRAWTLGAVLALTLGALFLPAPPAAAGEVAWLSHEEGMNLSRTQNKTAMLDFYADWCGPCREMDRTTYADPRVVERSSFFACIKVNGDREPDLLSEYDIEAYPTVVFLRPDGSEVFRFVGYHDADYMYETLGWVAGAGPKPSEPGPQPCWALLLPAVLVPAVIAVFLWQKFQRPG